MGGVTGRLNRNVKRERATGFRRLTASITELYTPRKLHKTVTIILELTTRHAAVLLTDGNCHIRTVSVSTSRKGVMMTPNDDGRDNL